MSGLAPPTQLPPPPPPPGLAQRIESGLVIAQFSQWFAALDRSDSPILSTVIIFVTVVGLAQSGIVFASAWSKYVQRFGMFPCEDWGDYVQLIPTLAISVPVQALMIRRCYYLVNKNMFIITPLVLLLVVSVVVSLWSTVLAFRYVALLTSSDPVRLQKLAGISWPYLLSILLPSVLDLTLTGILLYYLTRTAKRVYAVHKRRRIFRLANIVWQSALPPTLCAICVLALYLRFAIAPERVVAFWMPVMQGTIGKLYVLSLFYMINAQPLKPTGQLTTVISTLTVPMEVMYARTLDVRGGDIALSEIVVERGPKIRTLGHTLRHALLPSLLRTHFPHA
ncbi:hypothetical protein EDB92DRAFT_1948012 [Lactarius akahatsu]|uniref:DUF6534 domain-containing protein n=1 Tax=Lactarius akahatsu TaxID=416441 RepID=A0AAD4LCT8_9AGAM|nr:hypothetical protein EDB92DRAFT_1948012 [Lactarius akahatsu]